MRRLPMVCAAAALAACGQQAGDEAATNAPANAAAAKPKRPAYCFFKDSETKGWSAARDREGNVVVKGKAYRSDPRYKAELGPAEVEGAEAVVRPSIAPNSGYAAPDNWWDVAATVPNSAGVEKVTVRCGSRVLAELPLKRAG